MNRDITVYTIVAHRQPVQDMHLSDFRLPPPSIMGRSLPVMFTKGAGQIRRRWLVRSNANGWSSQCNCPSVSGSGEVARASGELS